LSAQGANLHRSSKAALEPIVSGFIRMATCGRRWENRQSNKKVAAPMPNKISIILSAGTVLLATPPALAQTKDHAPTALSSSKNMAQDKRDSESWTYVNPAANFTKYRGVIVDPTTVYNGPDAQFDKMDGAEREKYAAIMTDALRKELGEAFPMVADADNLRVHVTLLGGQKTKGGIATATRVTTFGFAASALKSAMGKPGTFSGSLLFAVEAYDAKTGELLLAAVRRRTPDPLDIPSTLSTTDTVKAIARDFANAAHKRIDNLTQTGKP
jgi:hypothetical protein